MKRLFAMLIVLIVSCPADAHFIWLVPHKGSQVQMVFSDSLDPDGNVAITKIAQTKVVARSEAGAVDLKKSDAKDHYLFTFNGKPPVEVAGVCQYGVLAKKGDPFLLMYYAKTSIGTAAKASTGWTVLPLEIVSVKPGSYHVLFQGKPVADSEMTALIPGEDSARELKRGTDGTFQSGAIPATVNGYIGLCVKLVEKKAGEIDGKKYSEIRHYSTWTFAVGGDKKPASPTSLQGNVQADPAATKLLADARAARAVWEKFPGFRADLEVNINGKIAKGKVDVESTGKVNLKLEADDDVKTSVRREIGSLVGHRLPGGSLDTPCAFIGTDAQHPSGQAIRVLNDELHSSYRIRDRQIIEVNRAMKDIRFTITVLENSMTPEKQYLPTSYVVSSWDVKTNALVSSSAHHNTWTRIGAFDLPVTVRVVNAKAGQLDHRLLTFSNLQLVK